MLVSISYEYILFIILSTRFLRNRSHVIALREKTRKNLTIGRSNCDFFPRSFYLSYRDTNPNIFDINCDIAQRRHNFSLERFRDVATATSILRVIVQRRSSRLFLIEKKKRRRISNEIGNIRKHFSLRL